MAPGTGTKRKKNTTITFSRAPLASSAAGSSSSPLTGGVLREKTSIRVDGATRQKRSIVQITLDEEHRTPRVHPDVARLREPVYEPYSAADHGEYDEDYDEGGRAWRAIILFSNGPKTTGRRIWPKSCVAKGGATRLMTLALGVMSLRQGGRTTAAFLASTAGSCFALLASSQPIVIFHSTKIQRWDGAKFEQVTLKALGLRIQLGHWHGSVTDRICPLPLTAPHDDFVIIDTSGVHPVHLDYCNCGLGGHPTVQLLRARLWAATTTNPQTAATFSVLRRYHLLSFEAKCAALEFYQSLARESDNLHYKKDKDRYREFGEGMIRPASLGPSMESARFLCPACPQPGKNLPADWRNVPDEKQFLYALFLALDANFRLKRKDVSSEEKDPGLGNGWAFYCEVKKYMQHVKEHWNDKQDRSHCVAHDAVDKPDREARGTASSGIAAVDCARHNMKRPQAVGDLQLGERYMNMDYMFFSSIAGTEVLRFFVSYDIACQWHLKIWGRMQDYDDATLTVDGDGKFFTFLVPQFSFHLTRDVGQTDGEAPERGWADANPLARSTKEMGPGFRRDTVDDHFNDWNHKKIIALGHMLRRKVENAVPEMVKTRRALEDMNESVGPEVVGTWVAMAELWEKDITKPNPFETIHKDQHVAKVRAELAAEAAERELEGKEDEGGGEGGYAHNGACRHGRILGFDVADTGLHPTDGQRRAMTERTSKLRRKIFAWMEVQQRFFPALTNIRARDDEARARHANGQAIPGVPVSGIALWLPSAIARAAVASKREIFVNKTVFEHEYRLRVGQASEALHEIRRLLLVRTHLYKSKDTHSRGVRANMRSGDKIAALNEQIKRAAATYRAAHGTLEYLGKEVGRSEWSWMLQPLKEEDVRGLPRAQFHDPERKDKTKKKRKSKRARRAKQGERQLSWIWLSRGEQWKPGDDAAMNEAVRIEWAKTRARSMRWREEVDLLEEEMRRVTVFLRWRSEWWRQMVGQRELPVGPQLEGETAYALRQADVQAHLADSFEAEGRDGTLVVDDEDEVENDEQEESDGEEEEEDNSEEEEAIPKLPQRPIKPTYVDEVLVMIFLCVLFVVIAANLITFTYILSSPFTPTTTVCWTLPNKLIYEKF
ncbi:CxC2 domain-containing protein [Mycena sanguinolenta]|uniref:CxC2 domain-containing protein n=1 Tax=Mycena sanguinolenta TaxID=230812 RepID=A0A8H6YVW1_9AGAR|nr:CxC2 domain-containing protein [Mycena sanguinolenta]